MTIHAAPQPALATTPSTPCPVCGNPQPQVFVEVPQVPVLCNILWPTKVEATSVRRVDIPLAYCPTCGYIFNPTFDPALMDYSQVYENSLHFSPRFQQFAETLAADLVARHDLHYKKIIEISCGKGDFLKMLCALGENQGYGFDPSYVPEVADTAPGSRVTFVQDFYAEAYAHYEADFICCRHTLEHIQDPVAFLTMVRRTIGERSIPVYFEVPNVRFTLQDLAVWDIIYEHCAYFSQEALRYLFERCGFAVIDIQPTYEGQFLYIEARPRFDQAPVAPAPQAANTTAALTATVNEFAERYRQKVATEEAKLAQIRQAGQKVVIWGAGSKGITFLNMLRLQGQIEYAVDLNVRKQGMFITGTGQQIVAPAFLQGYHPDFVIVMNPIYLSEIQQMISALGVNAALVGA